MSDCTGDSGTEARSVDEKIELRRQLEEARQTLEAIRHGDVDALVVIGPQGERIYSLAGAEHVYRVIVETMHEAALTVDPEGTILFCNQRFCDLMKTSTPGAMGHKVTRFAARPQQGPLRMLLTEARAGPVQRRLLLQAANGASVPVQLSASPLHVGDNLSLCLVASDLTELEKSAHSIRILREHEEAMQEANERLQVQMEQLRTLNDMLQARQEQLEAANEDLRAQEEELCRQGQALCHSEEWLALAASGTRIGMYDRNVATGETLWTEQVARLLGLRTTTTTTTISQRYHYHDWSERVHPEDLPRVEADLRRCMAQHLPREAEYRVIWPDGSVHWLADRGIFQYGPDGQCTRMLGILMDITERKRAEEILKIKDKAIASSLNAIAMADQQGCLTYVNPAFLKLWGYDDESEVLGKSVLGFWKERQQALETLRATQSGAGWVGELVAVRKDGTCLNLYLSAGAVLNEAGVPLCVMASFMDITERRQAEEELRHAYGRLRTFFDQRIDGIGIIVANAKGDILQANDYYLGILGCTREELTSGQVDWRRMTPPEWLPADERALAQLAERGVCDTYEKEYVRRDGSRVPVLITDAMMPGESGDVLAFVLDITQRKQAEESLRQSEQRFRAIYEHGGIGIALGDLQGRLTFVNPALEKMLGYQEGELIGRNFRDLTLDRDLPPESAYIDELLTGERDHYSIEKRYLRKDGEAVWIALSGSVLRDSDGQPAFGLAMVQDITGRKRAEEALRQRTEELQTILDTTPVAIFLAHDPECRKMTGNPAAQELVKLPPDANISKSAPAGERPTQWQERRDGVPIEPDDLPLQRAAHGEEVRGYEMDLVFEDGTVKSVMGNATPIRDENGKPRGGVAILMDITERKRAEETLHETRDYLDSLFGYANAPIVVWDRERKITRFNHAFERLTGRQASDVLGREIGILFPPDGREESLAHIRATSEGQQWEVIEIPILCTDGTVKTVLWNSANVLTSDHQTVVATIAQGQDITERKQAEEALRELNATLESKVAQRTAELAYRAKQLQKLALELTQAEEQERRRIAVILHEDLQQQIAGAKFHLNRVQGKVNDDRLRADIEEVGEILKGAIEQSRSLSRDLSPAVVNMNDLAEVLQWLAHRIQAQQGLTVNLAVWGDLRLHSEALALFLFRAVQEMLFNVVKHAQVREAAVRVRRIGRYVCLSVSDQGRGFDAQALKETAGVGLFSIRERTELLGGRFKVQSVKGKGSRFRLMIPDGQKKEDAVGVGPRAYPTPAILDNHEGKEGNHGGLPLRVLLVDDHDIVRKGLAAMLRAAPGIELVGEAPDGRRAIDMAADLRPDVVIMDVSMPLMKGDEAARQIKTCLPKTRVIALSVYDEADKKQSMFEAGAERYILKTISAEELIAAIRGEGAGGR